jgi:hypothetical protein
MGKAVELQALNIKPGENWKKDRAREEDGVVVGLSYVWF